jgi:hypothetical protein
MQALSRPALSGYRVGFVCESEEVGGNVWPFLIIASICARKYPGGGYGWARSAGRGGHSGAFDAQADRASRHGTVTNIFKFTLITL